LNFFQQIHRSVFDPPFYRDIAVLPGRQVVLFIVKLLLLTTVITGMAHTWYLFDTSRGIAKPIEAALGGMEIKNGELYPNRPLPCELQPMAMAALFSRLFGSPANAVPVVTVDTVSTPAKPAKPVSGDPSSRIILQSKGIAFCLPSAPPFLFSYKNVLLGSDTFGFSAVEIKHFLVKNVLLFFALYCFFDGLRCAGLVLFSICILAIAPYIFRIERDRTFTHFLSIAGFAVSPIPIGFMFIALSGAIIPSAWEILIIAATLVMFRAMMSVMGAAGGKAGQGER
jgi:hypothetical protein